MVNNSPNYDQIAFDMAFTHLAQQGVRSTEPKYAGCRYRSQSPEGECLKCGLGCLISDDDYSVAMETENWNGDMVLGAIQRRVGGIANEELLGEIQRIHDDYEPDEWEARAHWIAKEFNLSSLSTATIDALDWSACEATA